MNILRKHHGSNDAQRAACNERGSLPIRGLASVESPSFPHTPSRCILAGYHNLWGEVMPEWASHTLIVAMDALILYLLRLAWLKVGIVRKISARKSAEWHARELQEMTRRMNNLGEMVAYVGQRVTVAVLGIFMILVVRVLTEGDPPLFVAVVNFCGLLAAGLLIIFVGDELIRLSDFDKWRAARIEKIRENLNRAGLIGSQLDAAYEHLVTAQR